jgi:CreA protein
VRSLATILALFLFVLLAGINPAWADDIGCLDTTFKLLSPNDSVCVSAFEDPKVHGVTCHISQARKGGWGSVVGLTEDPSRFSIACRQTGPISLPEKLPDQENVFSERTSIFFKNTKVIRMFDKKHNTLVYLAVSTKLIEGSPQNSISTVPIMPWGGK